MATEDIVELTAEPEFRAVYPIVEQLRPVGEDEFVELVDRMRSEDGYRLIALEEDGSIRGVAGFVVQTNLYQGKHVWVHDLVVDEPHRGRGYGSRLLSWIESWADDRDCTCIELASGLWREETHEFYEDYGMEKFCYTFTSDLPAEKPY